MLHPTTSLQPSQTYNEEVVRLQNFLINQGLLTEQQVGGGVGIYGPITTEAVRRWQDANGVDNTSGPGFWGPRSIQVASTQDPTVASPDQGVINESESGKTDADQPYTDAEYTEALNNNPIIKDSITKGNTAEELAYAASSGDFSGLVNQFGQPFSIEDQQKALKQAEDDTALYFTALKDKETADVESALFQKKADYQDFLIGSGERFKKGKTQLDVSAAERGVLFSGGRVQKERSLESAYRREQSSALATTGRDIGNVARDYQYKYGGAAAGSLSQAYNLGSNIYDASRATGGVTSGALSNIYDPSRFNFQGTQNVAQKAAASQRAAGFLWSKGKKLLATGYQNTY